MVYDSEGNVPKTANRSPQAPSLHFWPWIHSAAHFTSVEGTQVFVELFSFSTVQIDTAEFFDRVCSIRGMINAKSKIKLKNDYGKLFLKVSLKI